MSLAHLIQGVEMIDAVSTRIAAAAIARQIISAVDELCQYETSFFVCKCQYKQCVCFSVKDMKPLILELYKYKSSLEGHRNPKLAI